MAPVSPDDDTPAQIAERAEAGPALRRGRRLHSNMAAWQEQLVSTAPPHRRHPPPVLTELGLRLAGELPW